MLDMLSPQAQAALVRLIDERVAQTLETHADPERVLSPWMTVAEAAEYIRTTPGAIYKRIKRGQLQAFRPEGSGIRIRREDLDWAGPPAPTVL
jgi:excisionase family DNA binding protein